tara:strand:- start:176 stop:391 length:216 start_codon:yes stop_codon:yes gene_type:complete
MCIGGTPQPTSAPSAPPAATPVQSSMYNADSSEMLEKGAVAGKAAGTSQLRVDLDPTISNMGENTGLQITK